MLLLHAVSSQRGVIINGANMTHDLASVLKRSLVLFQEFKYELKMCVAKPSVYYSLLGIVVSPSIANTEETHLLIATLPSSPPPAPY